MAQIDVSVKLAFDRTRAAYNRTMMAWIRTATSLISFGFGIYIYKFFQLDMKGGGEQEHRLIGPREFALLMVGAALLSLPLGIVEHRQGMRSLRAQYADMPRSRTGLLAALLAALGILALIAVILRQ
jgi:putative membrane protein